LTSYEVEYTIYCTTKVERPGSFSFDKQKLSIPVQKYQIWSTLGSKNILELKDSARTKTKLA